MSGGRQITPTGSRRDRRFVIALALFLVPMAGAAQSAEFGPPYVVAGDFFAPCGVAVDVMSDRVLVADTGHHRVRFASIASLTGAPTWNDVAGAMDPAAPESVGFPQGVGVDASGNLFIVDTVAGEVQLHRADGAGGYVYDPSFAATTRNVVAGVPIRLPRDIAVGADGRVYLLDSGNNRVLVADGAADDAWSVLASSTEWSSPFGLDVGADGTLFLADTGNHVIRRIAPDGSEVVFGGYGTANGQFREPRDVAVAPDGRLFIADTQNHRVSVLRPDGAFAVNLGTAPLLVSPQKVTVDALGRIAIVDSDAARVVAFLGDTVPPPYDLYVRDYPGDLGAEPFTGQVLFSPDILVRWKADLDLARAAESGLDAYYSEPPRPGVDNYVYVAVRNRGSQAAADAVLRMYWADPEAALTSVSDWKTDGFFAPDGAGGLRTMNEFPIPEVDPAHVVDGKRRDGVRIVGPIVWRPPPDIETKPLALVARVLSRWDPLKPGRGVADVEVNNGVAWRGVNMGDEEPDGSFVLDVSGDVYVQLLYSKARYANYLSFDTPLGTAKCEGSDLSSCYAQTRWCSSCAGWNDDRSCACKLNATWHVGRLEAGQKIATALHSDHDRDGDLDQVYWANPARNAGHFDYVRTHHVFRGAWIQEWEDGGGDYGTGGDRDFNDLVVMIRVVPDQVAFEAAQLSAPSLFLLSNVVVEDAAGVGDPRVRLSMLVQNADTEPRQAAVCPMLNFSDAVASSRVYTYLDNADGSPGDGTPDDAGPGQERISVRFSRDERWTNKPPHPAPAPGDLLTIPGATGDGPGEIALHYEIPISRIDAAITDPALRLGKLSADELVKRITANGLETEVFTDVQPGQLVCAAGPMTTFDGQARQVATVHTGWSDPTTYRIASPAFVEIPTTNPRSLAAGAPPLYVQLEYYWSDNLPTHLHGHIVSEINPRTKFYAGPAHVTKVPVRLNFPDDLPEGFEGKLEAVVREVYTGRVIVSTTRTFSKDNLPPTIPMLDTRRTPENLSIRAVVVDPSGVAAAHVVPNVNGVASADLELQRTTSAPDGSVEMTGVIEALARLDVVGGNVFARDRGGLTAGPFQLAVANLGAPTFECNAHFRSMVQLDGTRSTGLAPLAYAWTGPFGTATGEMPTVAVPLGRFPIELAVSDQRGHTGVQTDVVSVRDTMPPNLEVEAGPRCLWPPDHKYVPFRIGENVRVTAVDICDEAPRYRIVSVSSSEPDSGLGDGDAEDDVVFGDDGFCIRAERAAGGRGRTYTALLEAVDASGNRTERTLQIAVPHDASLDERCPALPAAVFADAGDARCRFGPIAPATRAPADADERPAGSAPRRALLSGCSTGAGATGTIAMFLTAVAAARPWRRWRRSRPSGRWAALVALTVAGAAQALPAATAPLSVAREGHTATALNDGRVLVVGGRGESELASAEIFDPRSETWSLAGSLAYARRGHTATLLRDGRVLVVGGSATGDYGVSIYPAATEIYDPATNAWTIAGGLGTPRAGHTATLLVDGRVLVAGGYRLGDLDACEVFDPATNAFAPTGALGTRRYGHAALRLTDGRVVVLGGASSSQTGTDFTRSVEVWDAATGSWSSAPPMLEARYRFGAALVGSEVLVAGGANDNGPTAAAERYSVASGARAISSLGSARASAATVSFSDGVAVIGGYDLSEYGAERVQDNAERYDSPSGRWRRLSLSSPRSAATATLLGDGRVLVAGGWNGSEPVATAELLTPDAVSGAGGSGGCGCSSAPGTGVEGLMLFALLLLQRELGRRGRTAPHRDPIPAPRGE